MAFSTPSARSLRNSSRKFCDKAYSAFYDVKYFFSEGIGLLISMFAICFFGAIACAIVENLIKFYVK